MSESSAEVFDLMILFHVLFMNPILKNQTEIKL
jgi:hypothetical protein